MWRSGRIKTSFDPSGVSAELVNLVHINILVFRLRQKNVHHAHTGIQPTPLRSVAQRFVLRLFLTSYASSFPLFCFRRMSDIR